MKILISQIENGAEYNDIIHDSWITGILPSERTIRVFNYKQINLYESLNQTLDCLISAGFIMRKNKNGSPQESVLEGTLIEKVDFLGWELNEGWNGILTSDGTFLLDQSEVKENSFVFGENVSIQVGRFDLIAVRQWEC